jgi:pimeloyl-ACP methyl ester carboxylesterase
MPEASREQIDSMAALQNITTSPRNAAALRGAIDRFSVTSLLGKVATPTLVLHARDDGVQPLEQGRELAAGIPRAEFVMLDSSSHITVPGDRAWEVMISAIDRFVSEG